jgi:RNA polymerase sigma factor (sigma-70 family)
MEQTQKIIIYDALETLKQREQGILKLYYLAGFSEEEISEHYHISIPRVNQIKKRALEKCKIQLEKKPTFASIV